MSNASHNNQDKKKSGSLLKQVLFSIFYLALTAGIFGTIITALMFSVYFWYFLIGTFVLGLIGNRIREDESTKRAEVGLQRFAEHAVSIIGTLVVILPIMIVAGIGFPILAIGGVVLGVSQNNLLLIGFGIFIGYIWFLLFAGTLEDIPGSFKKLRQRFQKNKEYEN